MVDDGDWNDDGGRVRLPVDGGAAIANAVEVGRSGVNGVAGAVLGRVVDVSCVPIGGTSAAFTEGSAVRPGVGGDDTSPLGGIMDDEGRLMEMELDGPCRPYMDDDGANNDTDWDGV